MCPDQVGERLGFGKDPVERYPPTAACQIVGVGVCRKQGNLERSSRREQRQRAFCGADRRPLTGSVAVETQHRHVDHTPQPFELRLGQCGPERRDCLDDPDLRAEIEAAVEDANKAVSKAESIRKFTILPDEWTEEGGQLTPSLKIRRNVVMREFKEDVAALYVS